MFFSVTGPLGLAMATSALCQSSPLGSPSGSPRSCFYMARPHSLQPKADWRASFSDTKMESGVGAHRTFMSKKPLILRQHNGVWLTRPKDTSHEKRTQSDIQSSEEKGSEDTVASPSKSRLSLGRTINVLRCHVCLSTVKEQHFHNHLFFGAVRCELCFTICQDCRVFEWLSTETEGYNKCHHKFTYCEDPYKYLLPRLCGSDDYDTIESSTLPHNLRVLQNYSTKLASLQLREPWSTALRTCKTHLLRAFRDPKSESTEGALSQQDSPLAVNTAEDLHVSKTHEEDERLRGSITPTSERLTSSSPVRGDSDESESSEDGLLLTQNYDLEHLEQEVEYVELENNRELPQEDFEGRASHSSKPKKRRKNNHRKSPRSSESKKRTPSSVEQIQEEEDLVTEQVELPEDGYYLMVRQAVEECPMCYESLHPTMCTVNIRTFLFTVRCPGCNLIIYMVPDLPDGLKIVTEDTSTNVDAVHKESTKPKTKTRVHARHFFAR